MAIPTNIGRFKVLRELGQGSQGVVYLAQDPRLEREVAIKTLAANFPSDSDGQSRLMQEARTVSKLQHPNIIPVYEAGEYQGKPYLVFECVQGITLRDLIGKEGAINPPRALKLMQQIIDGVAYAHQQGVIHRDLKPANIMINKEEVPRIMDFGIAIMARTSRNGEVKLAGTPRYMSPEHFSSKAIGPHSDVFSLGLIFHEMLTGQPVIRADNHFSAMYQITNTPVNPPSQKNNLIDNELDKVIMKALEKDPEDRYGDAQDMRTALNQYLATKDEAEISSAVKTDSNTTLDFILRRMRQKSDFPAFSEYLLEINKKAALGRMNYISASQLANAIVKDYALTNKLLRLVNSAFYGQFAGKVCTVSRAVMILGFEQVRLAASSLVLFEHLQNKSQSMELKESAIGSFMSGLIAKQLAEDIKFDQVEESFICAMLHKLGKHLVIFYLPEEYMQIQNRMLQKGVSEEAAARVVLGISYGEIGIGVAKVWRFPEKIFQSMQRLPAGKVDKPKSEEEMLINISNFSNELCQIMVNTAPEERSKALSAFLNRFESSFPLNKQKISKLLNAAMEKVEKYADILKINLKKSNLMMQLQSQAKVLKDETLPDLVEAEKESMAKAFLKTSVFQGLEIEEDQPAAEEARDAQTILINGIQEITNTLLEDFELNQVLTMIMETLYRAYGFSRVFFCLLNQSRTKMKARFGFGKDIERIIEDFRFPISPANDIFTLALAEHKALGVDNVKDPNIAKLIPDWYFRMLGAPAFIIYPIVVDKQSLGLIYADREQTGKVITGDQLKYMRTLCNQAVMALKQRKQKL
jgi:serine/threonine protein kinase